MNRLRIFLLFTFLLVVPILAFAIYIPNPDNIKVKGLASLGEDGAAWLDWRGHSMLVSSGYMIGRDLRVVAIRHDSVVLYSPKARQYHVLLPKMSLAYKDRTDVLWTGHMKVWKMTRMVARCFRKDYICNYLTSADNLVRTHVRNMQEMMDKVVSPNHRFYGKDGIIYVAPVHVKGIGWRFLMHRIEHFRSKTLGDQFKKLNSLGTIISDGRPIDQILQRISYKTGVRIIWQHPSTIPLYCSFHDRAWYDIISKIIIFNGLTVTPTSEGLVIK